VATLCSKSDDIVDTVRVDCCRKQRRGCVRIIRRNLQPNDRPSDLLPSSRSSALQDHGRRCVAPDTSSTRCLTGVFSLYVIVPSRGHTSVVNDIEETPTQRLMDNQTPTMTTSADICLSSSARTFRYAIGREYVGFDTGNKICRNHYLLYAEYCPFIHSILVRDNTKCISLST
jgi:hypothetical protein